VKVYRLGFGAILATANTDVVIAERLLQTDAGLSSGTTAPSLHVVSGDGFRVRNALHELRRVSGLTWENLADVLNVTRRSLHLWVNGGSINSPNEKHVRDLLVAIRAMDRGTATENRQLLLTPVGDGRSLMDLLRHSRFDEAVTLAGRGMGRTLPFQIEAAPQPTSLMQLSVADMLGTNPERIHSDDGRYLPSRRRPKR
jgi:hypothetical protein